MAENFTGEGFGTFFFFLKRRVESPESNKVKNNFCF